ncbi:MAG TPA: hypothetical protein VFK47_08980, partial [Ktedonobacteraceae bacterium]|nr:hypothetical protein [Ktedonobacteraceae bacterium]
MTLILAYLVTVVGLINTIHLALYIGGANIYDIKQLRRTKRMPKAGEPINPLVTVIIPAHNEELVIERGLDSVRNSTYP